MRYTLPGNYRAYMFDLYGTLVNIHTDDDTPYLWQQLALWYQAWGISYTPAEIRREVSHIFREEAKRLKKEHHTEYPEVDYGRILELLYRRKGTEPSEELICATGCFYRRLTLEYVRLYPGTAELLQSLRAAGKRVYLLTNAQAVFTRPELEQLGLPPLFDEIRISSERGIRKPDPRFFTDYLRDLGLRKEDCLYVGNDARYDVAGAKAAGMDSFYVRSNLTPKGQRAPEATYERLGFTGWKAMEKE